MAYFLLPLLAVYFVSDWREGTNIIAGRPRGDGCLVSRVSQVCSVRRAGDDKESIRLDVASRRTALVLRLPLFRIHCGHPRHTDMDPHLLDGRLHGRVRNAGKPGGRQRRVIRVDCVFARGPGHRLSNRGKDVGRALKKRLFANCRRHWLACRSDRAASDSLDWGDRHLGARCPHSPPGHVRESVRPRSRRDLGNVRTATGPRRSRRSRA